MSDHSPEFTIKIMDHGEEEKGSTIDGKTLEKDSNMLIENDEKSGDDAISCPLFMEGLPTDFSSNAQLAALASLLDEEEHGDETKGKNGSSDASQSNEERGLPPTRRGGGKLKRIKGREKRHNAPYAAPKKNTEKSSSLGEAQLFMKMWKL